MHFMFEDLLRSRAFPQLNEVVGGGKEGKSEERGS